ncbi:MAG: sigma-70 family RNA polymerase sigma factor, partial [Planctomycetota bacterium]|nr:sigma-70 family RNA polymerase sigma factor [Planctomycetota bacterium]
MAASWEEEALRRWRENREDEALGELLKSRRDRAYSVALRLTGSPADAEDAVQDAFLKLMSRTKGFEGVREFDIAVYRAVVQCGLDMVRERRRRAAREAAAGTEMAGIMRAAKPEGAMDDIERQELLEKIGKLLAELPEGERAAVTLCYSQGMSVSDAAAALGVSRLTLR